MEQHEGARLPAIYYVNWFRKGPGGDFLWPGFGENSRVLKWIFERCLGTAKAVETPIGNLPAEGGIDLSGLDIAQDDLNLLLGVDTEGWLEEIPLIREYYASFGDRLPAGLSKQLDDLEERLRSSR